MDLDVGPLIRQSQQQRVWDFLSDAQVAGIPVVAQGQVVDEAPESGFYQAPTLLRDVPPDHRLAQEEVFGPVLAAMPFDDEADAIRLANGTDFGLVAACGRVTARASSAWRGHCAAARSSSTTTARAAAWSCRLAASNPAATAAKKGLRRCTASRC
jgi:acyl-CoA reductase-like NAD-dependent aldehyde dehydrogenase